MVVYAAFVLGAVTCLVMPSFDAWAGVNDAQACVGVFGSLAIGVIVAALVPSDHPWKLGTSVPGALGVLVAAIGAPPTLRRAEAYGWGSLWQLALWMMVASVAVVALNAWLRAVSRRRNSEEPDAYWVKAPYAPGLSGSVVLIAALIVTVIGSSHTGTLELFIDQPLSRKFDVLVGWQWWMLALAFALAAIIVLVAARATARSERRHAWRHWIYAGTLLVAGIVAMATVLDRDRGDVFLELARTVGLCGAAAVVGGAASFGFARPAYTPESGSAMFKLAWHSIPARVSTGGLVVVIVTAVAALIHART